MRSVWQFALYVELVSVNFVEAIEVLKKFPALRPKVFKGFLEWGVCDTETDGYVVLTKSAINSKPDLTKLKDYVECHNLRIDHVDGYLMICTHY